MAAKKTAKSTKKSESTASDKTAWIGVSADKPRLGQNFSVTWRVPGKPREFVGLWAEGPEGDFHYTVPPKGSRRVAPLAGGKHSWSIHEAGSGKELARVELTVKT